MIVCTAEQFQGEKERIRCLNVVIGVADMKVSNKPEETLITYSLGSCVGVVVYDPVVRVGGILHFMLPESSLDEGKARSRPFMFADTGIPGLFLEAYKYGAVKQRMKIIVAGGARILDTKGFFNIGKKNYIALRKIFWRNNVIIDYEDIGGCINRTMKMDINSGDVSILSGRDSIKTISYR